MQTCTDVSCRGNATKIFLGLEISATWSLHGLAWHTPVFPTTQVRAPGAQGHHKQHSEGDSEEGK